MSCIDQLRRIRETASGHCADILDRAIAALEDEQGTEGAATRRPPEEHAPPKDDEHNWLE